VSDSSDYSLRQRAREILDNNAKKGPGYFYVAPSNRKYPHQWSWDSSFHAIVHCHLDRPQLARDELLTLLSNTLPDGRLPHLIHHDENLASFLEGLLRRYWRQPGRSPLVQPPVVAMAAKEVWDVTEDAGFLKEALPLLERHFEWLHRTRRSGESALVSIISPWECGLDHKPAFDPLMGWLAQVPFGLYIALYTSEMRLARLGYDLGEVARRGLFSVREVLFNTVYAVGLEALAAMFAVTGDAEKAERFAARGAEVERAILSECYDPNSGLYFDVDANTGQQLREPSVSCLLPIAVHTIPKQRCERLLRHLTNPGEYWLGYPIPSVPRNNPHFRPHSRTYLWRGPTWINTNWLIASGLRRHGYGEEADALAEKSRELVTKSGFREYYNPFTGEGGGAVDFGWSTLAAVM
jgi:glycogen debranching enzyme